MNNTVYNYIKYETHKCTLMNIHLRILTLENYTERKLSQYFSIRFINKNLQVCTVINNNK